MYPAFIVAAYIVIKVFKHPSIVAVLFCYNKVMKIILFTYDLSTIGGIETSFFQLAQYLKRSGYNVGVRFGVSSSLQLQRFKEAGIDISQERNEVCDVLLIGSVWRQPKMIAAKLTVQQIHADWTDKFWNGAGSGLKMIKMADDNVDIYACVSESAASFVRKATNKQVIVMNNLAPEKSVVKRSVKRSKGDKVVFSAFTRMTSEKGLKNYQAFRERVIELGINAEFKVFTTGDAPDGWELCEPIKDIKTVFGGVDYVVSLADTESFGYTIAEANSCGIPCIIKRCNSTSEFFSDKDNLILDDVQDFDKKSLKLKVSSYKLREMSEASVDKAIKLFETMQSSVVILRCKRNFYDIEAKVNRSLGQRFPATSKRAKELLDNEYNIVEEI